MKYASKAIPAIVLCLAVCMTAHAAETFPMGDPITEGALAARDDIMTFMSFENMDGMWWLNYGMSPSGCTAVQNPVFDGTNALRAHVPQGGSTGMDSFWPFQRNLGYDPEEAYFRYYMYVDPNWVAGTKIPGFDGLYTAGKGQGGSPVNGYDSWSARMVFNIVSGKVELRYYCYHADMQGIYGDGFIWDGLYDRGKWYSIECYVKMNTVTASGGLKDGILKGWVDGKLVLDKRDIRFRHIEDLKVRSVWFNVWAGSSPQDMDLYFDNMVISANPIGPYTEPQGIRVAPVTRRPGPGHTPSFGYDAMGRKMFPVRGNRMAANMLLRNATGLRASPFVSVAP